ncbi:uncharacterized protein SOCG_01652 [Schizosaccharomyces octosporus yFS286]|uniref:Uncharacterized protein n=1 Tax=Schizosaccharomyces octosporus (strain yFS286) TaxID=483514 RepID=S9RBC2_SCHOY|nr:uncharacterized protein SOCG_01652 [Schizosaccharomyces octosporus yFS286]EPX71434.1 hypothetical protein SOCG_01652 [Schizosaccharomyces octosporus yFS286]
MKNYFKSYSTKRKVDKDESKKDENLGSSLSHHDEMKDKPSTKSFSRDNLYLEDKMKELDSILRANDNYSQKKPGKSKLNTRSVLSPKDLNIQSKVNKNSLTFLKSDFSLPAIEDPSMSNGNLSTDKQRIDSGSVKNKSKKDLLSCTQPSLFQPNYLGSNDQRRPYSSLHLFGNSIADSKDENSNSLFNSNSFCITSTPVASRKKNPSILQYNSVSPTQSTSEEDHSMEKYALRIRELERMLNDERHLNANHEKVIAEMKVHLKALRNDFQFAKKLFMNALAEHQEMINNNFRNCRVQSSRLTQH